MTTKTTKTAPPVETEEVYDADGAFRQAIANLFAHGRNYRETTGSSSLILDVYTVGRVKVEFAGPQLFSVHR